MTIFRLFLFRRRIDGLVLLLGSGSLPLRIGLGGVSIFLFSLIGVYIAAIRHNTARLFARYFFALSVAYGAWAMMLALVRDPSVFPNRELGYAVLFTMFAFAGPGMVLVRDPLRCFVLGSRLGVLAAAFAALVAYHIEPGRVGLGGNAVPIAMMVFVVTLAASISIDRAPRLLPNGPFYLLAGSIVIFLSQTRAILGLMPLILLIEIALYLQRYPIRLRMVGYVGIIAIGLSALAIGPVHEMAQKRFVAAYDYLAGTNDGWADRETVDIRVKIWRAALQAIADSPFVGYGSDRMQHTRDHLSPSDQVPSTVINLHNFVLDELLLHGIVGLALLLGAIGAGLHHIWVFARDWSVKRNVVYFAAGLTAYGAFHSPFIHEGTLAAIFLFIGALLADSSRRIMASRIAGANRTMRAV